MALVEPKVTWPALELGSPKVTRPTLEPVARPALDVRMPLVLWLRMDPGMILGLLATTAGEPEATLWVLERLGTLGVLSTFLTASASSLSCCSRACSRASSCGAGELGSQERACPNPAGPPSSPVFSLGSAALPRSLESRLWPQSLGCPL